jgi:hypothetical protein
MGHNHTITITEHTAKPALFAISLEKWRTLVFKSLLTEARRKLSSRSVWNYGFNWLLNV